MPKKQWRVYYRRGQEDKLLRSRLLPKEEAFSLLHIFEDAVFIQKEEGWFLRRMYRGDWFPSQHVTVEE
jgi:hypothetical protein